MTQENKLNPIAEAVKKTPPPNPLLGTVNQLQSQLKIARAKEEALNQTISEQLNQYITLKMGLNLAHDQMNEMQARINQLNVYRELDQKTPAAETITKLGEEIARLTQDNDRLNRVVKALDAEVVFMRHARGESTDGCIIDTGIGNTSDKLAENEQQGAEQDVHEGSTTD